MEGSNPVEDPSFLRPAPAHELRRTSESPCVRAEPLDSESRPLCPERCTTAEEEKPPQTLSNAFPHPHFGVPCGVAGSWEFSTQELVRSRVPECRASPLACLDDDRDLALLHYTGRDHYPLDPMPPSTTETVASKWRVLARRSPECPGKQHHGSSRLAGRRTRFGRSDHPRSVELTKSCSPKKVLLTEEVVSFLVRDAARKIGSARLSVRSSFASQA